MPDADPSIISSEVNTAQMRENDFNANIVLMIEQIVIQLGHGVNSMLYEVKAEKTVLTFMKLENIFGREDEILVIMKDVSEVQ